MCQNIVLGNEGKEVSDAWLSGCVSGLIVCVMGRWGEKECSQRCMAVWVCMWSESVYYRERGGTGKLSAMHSCLRVYVI